VQVLMGGLACEARRGSIFGRVPQHPGRNRS
jgi:hypothetical protein